MTRSFKKPPGRGRSKSRRRFFSWRSTRTSAGKTNRSSIERTREMAPVALASCLAAAVLVGLAIVPVRTWLTQQQKMDDARSDVARIEAEVADLERQLAELQTTDEIERRARQDFDLVFPGEESYRILPEPESEP